MTSLTLVIIATEDESKKDVSFVNTSFETVFEAGKFDVIVGTETKEFLWK